MTLLKFAIFTLQTSDRNQQQPRKNINRFQVSVPFPFETEISFDLVNNFPKRCPLSCL